MERYKTFPPRWQHIRVPLSSRAAARAAVGLYAPCTPRGYAVQRAGWLIVSALGARALPGRATSWHPPMPAEQWQALTAQWAPAVGRWQVGAVYERPQTSRSGFAVLLIRDGSPLAFVRLRLNTSASPATEAAVLDALSSSGTRTFWHPHLLGVTTTANWEALLTSTLPAGLHRPPARPDLDGVAEEVSAALADVWLRPDGVPAHWQPMHGDFTPWNVRRLAGRMHIFDWEDAGWGPPGADAVLYRATSAALRGGGDERAGTSHDGSAAEAAAFWLDRLNDRPKGERDDAYGDSLRHALRQLITESLSGN